MLLRVPAMQLAVLAGCAALGLLGATSTPGPVTTVPVQAASAAPLAPAILDISIAPAPLRPGKQIRIVVHTTPDVVSVQGAVLSFKFPVPKTADGAFTAAGKVPWFARLYHGTFHITFVALDAAGASAEMTESVRI
jgi:hypothetical protein